jgi:hypothetical protein
MRADKTDIDKVNGKFDNDNDAVIVAHEIENIPLVAYRIDRIEALFYIGKAFPFAMPDHILPLLQGSLRLRMQLDVLFQRLFREYPHMQR